MHESGRTRVAVAAGALILLIAFGAMGSQFRAGGRAGLLGSVLPLAGGNAAIDLFAGWGSLELSSSTEFSLFPYIMGDETLSFSLVRDWLCLSADYSLSLVPIGISAALVLARAAPPRWETTCGPLRVELAVESEARLKGDSFSSTPLRAELWVKGRVGLGRSLGLLDYIGVAAELEGTLSAPNGVVVPTPTLIASGAAGCAALTSETVLSCVGGIRVVEETLALSCSWHDLGITALAWCTFSEEPRGPSVGLRAAYEFGAPPLRPFLGGEECVGGVCR